MADADDRGPDLSRGIELSRIPDGGILAGHVGDTDVLLFRRDDEVHAVGGTCSHLGAPLAEGLVDGDRILCPWHHACFDLCTGEALEAPAFDRLPRWKVERRGTHVQVREKVAETPAPASEAPVSEVPGDAPTFSIVGGGAAAFAAAHQLRRAGFRGRIAMFSAEREEPYDRTLLTKDFLDGSFGEDALPIGDFRSLDVDFLAGVRVSGLDPTSHKIRLEDGRELAYARLLLATGAEPVRPDIGGIRLPHVHLLRSLADCRAILRGATIGSRVVVVGGSFIALETAAALRDRQLEVTIVAQEEMPLARIFGDAVAGEIRAVHERHGNCFEVGRTVGSIEEGSVILDDGRAIGCDLVVIGAGVRPRIDLAQAAQLAVADGVLVDEQLRTSAADVFAAGDIANWPDRHSGSRIRVEHWVVAQRQGQVAALNMLGRSQIYDDVPFFWTKHFDFSVRYVGHAASFDDVDIDGDVSQSDARIRYSKGGRLLAEATIGRDLACLRDKLAMGRTNG